MLTLALAAFSVVSLSVLSYWRWNLYGLHRQADRRLLLADVVLVIAALEILLDASVDVMGPSSTTDALHALALVMRGAFAAGAITLVISFPADERRASQIRRTAKVTKVALEDALEDVQDAKDAQTERRRR